MCSKGYVDIETFDYGLNGSYVVDDVFSLEVSIADVVRACLNSGKGKDQKLVISEVEFRTCMIRMMLEEKNIERRNSMQEIVCKIKRLVLSEVFCNLDSSEKVGVSFFMGMAMAGLIAEQLFYTPWLLHYDLYRKKYGIKYKKGKKPDLLGPERGEGDKWHVFEAKGRSSKFDEEVIEHAKEQKKCVSMVNGHEIGTANVVQSYFQGKGREMHVCLADPVMGGGENIKIDMKKFFVLYYGMINSFLKEMKIRFGERPENNPKAGGVYVETYGGEKFDVAYVACSDIHIGLLQRIRGYIDFFESEQGRIENIDKNFFYFNGKSKGNLSIGDDGILVILGDSWKTRQ